MRKTMFSVAFAAAFALLAGADGFVESNVDFADPAFAVGASNVIERTDGGGTQGNFFWWRRSEPARTAAVIVQLDNGTKCLALDGPSSPALSLARTAAPRSSATEAGVPVAISDPSRAEPICYELKASLPSCTPPPRLGDGEKLSLWTRTDAVTGETVLHVGCGSFTDGFRTVAEADCQAALPEGFDPDALHAIAIRAIPDVTAGKKVLGFTVSIDGVDIAADAAGYVPAVGFDLRELLTAEARILFDQRRLFLAKAAAGSDGALGLSGLAFRGRGHVGSIATKAAVPSALKPERVLTLRWDAGVKALSYKVSGSAEVRLAPEALRLRRIDLLLDKQFSSTVQVTAEYNTDAGFSPGRWEGRGGCEAPTGEQVTSGNFTYFPTAQGATPNPLAFVNSYRPEVVLGSEGDAGVATFTEAVRYVKANPGVRTIRLAGDFSPTNEVADAEVSGKERYIGALLVTASDVPAGTEALVLDLDGHTLYGAKNEGGFAAVENRGGRLRITDGSLERTGRIVPAAPFAGNLTDPWQCAVRNRGSQSGPASMWIEGGIFDGSVKNEKPAGSPYENTFEIAGGAFASTNSVAFEHQDAVTDPHTFFVYDGTHWAALEADVTLWTNASGNNRWDDGRNWRGGKVPAADEWAIFPKGGAPWTVSNGGKEPVKVGKVCFEGDVVLESGAFDFTDASWRDDDRVKADGRLSGAAELTWTGAVPPGDLSTLLAPDWAGTVRVRNVAKPKKLDGLATWGTTNSTVVFSGVNGYINDTVPNLTVPFALRLENATVDAETYGWKDVAGFTGGSVTFPRLLGDGAFVSAASLAAINQEIRFLDVSAYAGRIEVRGKRIVVGDGFGAFPSGCLTYANGVTVRSGLGWAADCLSFGTSFYVTGGVGDILAAYDAAKGTPKVDETIVTFADGSLHGLLAEGGRVTFGPPKDSSTVNGAPVRGVRMLLKAANSGARIQLQDPDMTVEGNEVKSGGRTLGSFADYYTVTATRGDGGKTDVRLALNENAVPVIGEFGEGVSTAMAEGEGLIWVLVRKTRAGLWYGLQFRASLDADAPWRTVCWQTASADGEDLPLYMEAQGTAAGFCRVIVQDVAPESNEEEAK